MKKKRSKASAQAAAGVANVCYAAIKRADGLTWGTCWKNQLKGIKE